MNDKKQDLIDRYIREEMNADERLAFEKSLSEDEELREMYKYTSKVVNAIKDRNEKLEKINKWKEEGTTHKKHNTKTVKFIYAVISAAAIITLMLIVNRHPSMPELDVHKYECYRGAAGISYVAQLITEKKYEEALVVIEEVEDSQKSDIDSLNVLLPNASEQNMQRYEYEISAAELDYNEMQWLKVYALMGLKRYDEAERLLREIIQQNGMYKEQADSLLQSFP